jgi:predicted NBD/HSP70 family sugar kinase
METEQVETPIGRRPTLISFNPDFATAIGAHIQREKLECALINIEGRILGRWEMPLSPPPDPDQVISSLCKAIVALQRNNTIGVGIAVSGLVDVRTGHEVFSPVLGWENIGIRKIVEENCHLPVRVENDANILAVAELLYGVGKSYSSFVCLMVGEGLGSGIIIEGRIYRGAFGGAGEIGHTTVSFEEDAPVCRCGERGCLEEFCSNRALDREAQSLGYPDWKAMATAARSGDTQAKQIFQRFGYLLGLGIKNVVNVVNPEAVIIGGELMEASDLFLHVTEETVRAHAFPRGKMVPHVLAWQVGQAGFLLGAAGLVEEEFLSSPILKQGGW